MMLTYSISCHCLIIINFHALNNNPDFNQLHTNMCIQTSRPTVCLDERPLDSSMEESPNGYAGYVVL